MEREDSLDFANIEVEVDSPQAHERAASLGLTLRHASSLRAAAFDMTLNSRITADEVIKHLRWLMPISPRLAIVVFRGPITSERLDVYKNLSSQLHGRPRLMAGKRFDRNLLLDRYLWSK